MINSEKHMKQKENKKFKKPCKAKKITTKVSNDKSKNIPKWKKAMIKKLTIMSIKNKMEQEKLCQQKQD